MTHVHYKFSSKLSYDTVVFDGQHVTLRDLKRQIMGREKLRAGDCDLQITNAQNKEEYTEDECSIPKGSSVIVRRIPVIGAKSSSSKTRHVERSDVQTHQAFGAYKAMDDQSSSRAVPLFSKMANLADVEGSEEDKIKVMINQSTYDMNYNKKFGTVLPANYTCYRCGNTGHHIRNCPVSADKSFEAPMRIKKSTGIPRSFMVEVDDPNTKGAMLTNCGRYAIPSIDIAAYAIGKKERPPFVPQEQPKSEEEEDPVPEELLCLICLDLLSDAVVIPCCGNSYCDDCIRTALLDSEEHVCPTCSQSEVSPDTLIANKFLRQAVDNFKKERGFTKIVKKGCGTSQSQNPTPTPSPVPTPPPLGVQSQPQKPYLPTHSQQDPLLPRSQAADTPPPSQVCGAPPTATGPASSPSTPSASLEPAESPLEKPDKEDEEKTDEDSAAAAAPSVPVSPKDPEDPTDAPSQLIPLVNFTPPVEPQTVSVNLEPPSSGPAPKPSGPSTWESSSSSSLCPTGGWNESNTQQLRPSITSYPATPPPPLFPSPHFHTFLAAQQPLSSYPPGYPPPAPLWTLPNLQGAPIPSLCPSTAIPALIPKEWYQHQRNKKERSPHRGSSHRRSSSRSDKSSKFKSSRSYSRSSSRSRSRSRSRSHGRSRPHSPYSRHRDLHSHSHSSRSYSFGYKRSPTPSSSSSPRVGYRSRPKSPSDHRKSSHHSRHHGKKSASSSSSSRKRGEHHQREAAASGGSLPGHLYAQHANQSGSLEQDRERYLQWSRHYKEWCDKYFSSYVGHFHQLPLPLLNIPPPPQWGDGEGSENLSRSHSDSRSRLTGRRSARVEGRSPPSQSSSDSRSPPSQSSRYSRSALSQSSSDSRSSPSHSSNESRSPPSQSSSDRRSTPSKDGAQPRVHQQKGTERYNRLSVTLTKSSKEVELQESREDEKQVITKNLENLSHVKHEQKKKHEEGRGEESSSPDDADSMDDCRKDKRRQSTGTKAFKDATPAQDEATARDAVESVQPPAKPDKRLDKDYERKSREHRNLEMEKGRRRSKHSDSRQDAGRRHREKPSKDPDMVGTDRYPGGYTASHSRSERNRKRKREDIKRSSLKVENSKCLKTDTAEDPKTRKSESPNPFDRKKPKTEKKKERKTWHLAERDIWEGGIRVKPQKKISININLDGKRKEEKTEKLEFSYLEKTKEEIEEKEKFNKETDIKANEKNESSRDMEGVSEGKIKPDEGEARQKWEKATFRDDEGEMMEKKDIGEKKEDREKEDFDLWHNALREEEEKTKESKQQGDERDGTEANNGEEELTNEWSVRGGEEGPAMGESTCKENIENPAGESKEDLMEGLKWRMWEEEEDTVRSTSQRSRNESQQDGPNTSVDDGSYEDRREKTTLVKTLQEFTEGRAADQEEELVLLQVQVPRSKWEKEESEKEERDEAATKAQTDALVSFLPSSSVFVTSETTTNREAQNEEKRERSVEREREKTPVLSSSHRSVAPSSGKDRNDSTAYSDRDGERRRNRGRGRESERPRERQKESKRSKERVREEEKGRDRERERNPPSSSHYSSHLKSRDTERRDRQRGGGDPGDTKSSPRISRKSSAGRSRATEVPDQNTHKSCRDTLLDSTFKGKDQPHYYHNHLDPPENKRHQDRPAGTHHSPPEPRMSSPAPEVMQNRSRNESRVEKEEWKLRQVKKEGKRRRVEEMVAVRAGGSRWEDEGVGRTKWETIREVEEGERTSSRSVSSSESQENGRKEKKKKQQEKRHDASELLEEEELKKTTKSRDGREEKSSGEVDAGWREEEELGSVTSS
ncbi:uncharacterized protein LOC142945120 isoform X2 [Anarhichas minor]|uniref:uncharacterized protein LOC142945120 isoform X2 n=1 Tax=Anarhichas minor TaxID=65739 RepID=UPI003F73A14C